MKKDHERKGRVFWMPICMSIGIGLALALGAPLGQTSAYLPIGIGMGLAVGGIVDRIVSKGRSKDA